MIWGWKKPKFRICFYKEKPKGGREVREGKTATSENFCCEGSKAV